MHTELFPYKVQVSTGTCPGAGTNANVYIILHGRDSHTGKIWLDNGRRTFLPGQCDEFDVTASDRVSPIETLTVGHDNSGPGPGWFLEKVRPIMHSSLTLVSRKALFLHVFCMCGCGGGKFETSFSVGIDRDVELVKDFSFQYLPPTCSIIKNNYYCLQAYCVPRPYHVHLLRHDSWLYKC